MSAPHVGVCERVCCKYDGGNTDQTSLNLGACLCICVYAQPYLCVCLSARVQSMTGTVQGKDTEVSDFTDISMESYWKLRQEASSQNSSKVFHSVNQSTRSFSGRGLDYYASVCCLLGLEISWFLVLIFAFNLPLCATQVRFSVEDKRIASPYIPTEQDQAEVCRGCLIRR